MESITKAVILKFISENDIELQCTHAHLCIPIIDRIYRKMSHGIKFWEIKVDQGMICDGHHRYVASLLAKYTLGTVPSHRTMATTIIDWKTVDFVEDDWDTPAKIKLLNELDAQYNDIPVEKIIDMLR